MSDKVNHQYLNLNIPNIVTDGDLIPPNRRAIFNESLTIPVLSNPSQYYVSIIRFTIPIDGLPILSFPVDPFQNNPLLSALIIGVAQPVSNPPPPPPQIPVSPTPPILPNMTRVTYVPQNALLAQPVHGSGPIYFNFNQANDPYYFIYSIQPFIDMINTALNASFVSAGSPGGTAPYYIYTASTQLISLIVTQGFLNSGYLIYMNSYLNNYLSSFSYTTQCYQNSGPYLYIHNLATLPYGSPSGGPYQFDQEYNSMDTWIDVRKIVITTGGIPIVQEASPTFDFMSSQNNGTANYFPIITDYSVTFDNINDFSTVLVYNPTAQYRLIDMYSNVPLTKVDLSFFWVSRNGSMHPLYINPGQSAEIKLAFINRNMYLS